MIFKMASNLNGNDPNGWKYNYIMFYLFRF